MNSQLNIELTKARTDDHQRRAGEHRHTGEPRRRRRTAGRPSRPARERWLQVLLLRNW
jgi:hypothetical protein